VGELGRWFPWRFALVLGHGDGPPKSILSRFDPDGQNDRGTGSRPGKPMVGRQVLASPGWRADSDSHRVASSDLVT
jgi:hypothetical protein